MPLTVLSRKLKRKKYKKVDSIRLSRESRPNPIIPIGRDEAGWVFTEEM